MVSTLKKHGKIWALLVAFSMMFAILPVAPASAATRCKVTFDTQGGSPAQIVQSVIYGGLAVQPADPNSLVANKVFTGWFNEAACTTAFDFFNPITADTAVYAKWAAGATYEVHFVLNGGAFSAGVADTVYVPAGKVLAPVPHPTKANRIFRNWYTDAGLTNVYDFTAPVNADLVLYAKWGNKPNTSGGGGGGGGTTTEQNKENTSKPDDKDKQDTPADNTPALILTDVQGHWAESAIKEAVAKGFVKGYPDSTFRPDANITRAEITALLVAAFEVPADAGGHIFADTLNHWAKEIISRAALAKIVSGYDENHFAPDQFITREQLAAMVVRAAKLHNTVSPKTFTDQNLISPWALEAVQIASGANANILAGYPDGSFRPQNTATRAETVVMILKALQLKL